MTDGRSNIDSRIRQAETEYLVEREETNLLNLQEEKRCLLLRLNNSSNAAGVDWKRPAANASLFRSVLHASRSNVPSKKVDLCVSACVRVCKKIRDAASLCRRSHEWTHSLRPSRETRAANKESTIATNPSSHPLCWLSTAIGCYSNITANRAFCFLYKSAALL